VVLLGIATLILLIKLSDGFRGYINIISHPTNKQEIARFLEVYYSRGLTKLVAVLCTGLMPGQFVLVLWWRKWQGRISLCQYV